jgi:hypothetical protein
MLKAKNHREAHKWDIAQQITMRPEESQRIASELKKTFLWKQESACPSIEVGKTERQTDLMG